MPKLSRDLGAPPYGGSPATLHPRESLWVAGNIAAVASEVGLAVDGCTTVAFSLLGTFVASFVGEGSLDGANWISCPLKGATWAGTIP